MQEEDILQKGGRAIPPNPKGIGFPCAISMAPNQSTTRRRRGKKISPRCTFHAPFSCSPDGRMVLDALGNVVAQFQDIEDVVCGNHVYSAASFVAEALTAFAENQN